MVIAPWVIWSFAAMMVASIAYSVYMTRKMSKANANADGSQLESSISAYGVSFSDICGSPHCYGNVFDQYDESLQAIKKKSGGK